MHTRTALYIPSLSFPCQFALVNVAYVGALGSSDLYGHSLAPVLAVKCIM